MLSFLPLINLFLINAVISLHILLEFLLKYEDTFYLEEIRHLIFVMKE